jgi:hypothetical protein
MIVQRWERSVETSVNKLSFAGSLHVRWFVWGFPGLRSGIDLAVGLKVGSGIPLPRLRSRRYTR